VPWWGSDFYYTATHVVPETSSDERQHVMDDTCWCRPLIDTGKWQIRHNAPSRVPSTSEGESDGS
jgi:hypothetical protein